MKTLKSLLLITSSLSVLFLGACSNAENKVSTPVNSPVASSPTETSSTMSSAQHEIDKKSGGGIVVESGIYHLELMPEKEGNETHLDLFVQKINNHETIPNAKVVAQVQLPDGSQQSIDMIYAVDGKHYTAKLTTTAVGEYKVVIQSEIKGEKVNARFTFKQ
jgi:hypothetical protein